MKYFAVLALFGLISAKDTSKTWELRSVLQHRDEAVLQKQFGDQSIERANSRPPMRSHVQMGSSSSSSSTSEDEDLQIGDFGPKAGAGYERVIPPRFTADSDDLFMRSMFETYAIEGAKDKEDGGGPNGDFFMPKSVARSAAVEVLGTHKGLTGANAEQYLATYWDKAWGHFDVNQTGSIAVYRMAELMRFLCSDQYMSLG